MGRKLREYCSREPVPEVETDSPGHLWPAKRGLVEKADALVSFNSILLFVVYFRISIFDLCS